MHAQKFLDDAALLDAMETEMKESINPCLVLEIRRTHLIADVLDQVIYL